jgi:16S rRNA processing protein RimM
LTATPQEPSDPDSKAAARLPAGRVGRPHGLDGSFYVTGPRPRLLALGKTIAVGGEAREIVRCAGTDRRPILRLRGIDDRPGAERLRGLELTLQEGDAPALEEGEWWAHELEGCDVRDAGTKIGRVVRMIELPSCEALEVQPIGGGATLLIPMVKDAIRALDVEQRDVDVDLSFLAIEMPSAAAPYRAGGTEQEDESA